VRKISPPTRIRSPDRPARSQSLYRLSYAGPQYRQNSSARAEVLLFATNQSLRSSVVYISLGCSYFHFLLQMDVIRTNSVAVFTGSVTLVKCLNIVNIVVLQLTINVHQSLLTVTNVSLPTQLVEALRYKSQGRGFDSRCYWNFSLT
jgi:hypothetical protein